MNKARNFLITGVWVAILSFLGFPIAIKNILFVLTGLLIIFMSYLLYLEAKKGKNEEKTFDNFSENKDFTKTEL